MRLVVLFIPALSQECLWCILFWGSKITRKIAMKPYPEIKIVGLKYLNMWATPRRSWALVETVNLRGMSHLTRVHTRQTQIHHKNSVESRPPHKSTPKRVVGTQSARAAIEHAKHLKKWCKDLFKTPYMGPWNGFWGMRNEDLVSD